MYQYFARGLEHLLQERWADPEPEPYAEAYPEPYHDPAADLYEGYYSYF